MDCTAPPARSEILQQPLDILKFELRAEALAEAAAQFLDDAARALRVDLTGHFDRNVVAVVAAAQRPAERVGLLLRARLAEPGGVAWARGLHALLLLHRLREILGAGPKRLERSALRVDRAVSIALAELALGLAHGFASLAELIHLAALALLALLALLAALA